nr:unnamed protein product [Spirometra erinaceieuropaei]
MQDSVRAPTLFTLMPSAMLMDAYRDERPRICIAYRTDGQLLNHRRMNFHSCVSTSTVHELLFADDCALNATLEGNMQRSMDLFSAACENFGLVINTEKTAVMHQPPPDAVCFTPQINLNGDQLQEMDNFTYLGSTLSHSSNIDNEVARRISKASQVSDRLKSTVWNRHGLQPCTKLKMYKAIILPTFLYGAETWAVYIKQERRLNPFHVSCLRLTLRIRWWDRIPDTDVVDQTGILSIHVMLRQLQLRWNGHLVRIDDERLPKRLFYGDVSEGSCRLGDQIRSYKDTLKTSLKPLQINPTNWDDLAQDRPMWRRTTKTGTVIYEANHIGSANPNARLANLNCTQPVPPTSNRLQRAHCVNGHFGRQLEMVDTFGTNTAPELHQASCLRSPLPRLIRRQLTMTALPNHHYHPPSPPLRLPLWRLPCPSTVHTIVTHQQTPTPSPSTSATRT